MMTEAKVMSEIAQANAKEEAARAILAALNDTRKRLQTAHEHIAAYSKQATKSTILPVIRYGIEKADAAIAQAEAAGIKATT